MFASDGARRSVGRPFDGAARPCCPFCAAAYASEISEPATAAPAGAAEECGLLPGDIILTLGDQIVTGVDDLHRFLTAERVNVAQNATLVRGTRVESLSIVPKSDG